MAALRVPNVPTEVILALERRAARHQRSLEGELRYILTVVAREEPPSPPLPPIELKLAQTSPSTNWSREEIYGDDGR